MTHCKPWNFMITWYDQFKCRPTSTSMFCVKFSIRTICQPFYMTVHLHILGADKVQWPSYQFLFSSAMCIPNYMVITVNLGCSFIVTYILVSRDLLPMHMCVQTSIYGGAVAPGVGTWIKSHYVMSYWCICHPHRSSCLITVLDMITLTYGYHEKWIVRCHDAECNASFQRNLLNKPLATLIFHNVLQCILIVKTFLQNKDWLIKLINFISSLFMFPLTSCICYQLVSETSCCLWGFAASALIWQAGIGWCAINNGRDSWNIMQPLSN